MAADRTLSPLFGPACAAALVAGALVCVLLPVLPPLWASVAATAVAALGWVVRWCGRVAAALLFGLAWTCCHGYWAMQAQLPAGSAAQDVLVRGQVIELPKETPAHTRFELRVDASDAMPTLPHSRRVNEIPFDSKRKRLSTVHAAPEGKVLYCKGAPEVVMPRCACATMNGGSVELSPDLAASFRTAAEAMAEKGLRVLAFAWRKLPASGPAKRRQRSQSGWRKMISHEPELSPPRKGCGTRRTSKCCCTKLWTPRRKERAAGSHRRGFVLTIFKQLSANPSREYHGAASAI